jgi:cytochrome c-type biogenesis protein CcmH
MTYAARIGVALLVLTSLAATTAVAASIEDQVYAIAGELMCPVCAGQTVAESNSALAVQMRQIIRERLQQGQTREEIIAYFVAQFGEHVLATPPRRGGGLLIWLMPLAVLGVGFAVLQRFIRRRHGGARPALTRPTPQEAEHIARELRKMD